MGYFIAWVCIGLGGALAACILPFRRGYLGVVLNVFSGVAGAVVAARVAVALGLSSADPRTLPVAVLGALALLAVTHLLWRWLRPGGSPVHRGGPAREA
jgi:uncharacterized membrane protein YeaQ/YmgE (transglycosylase-associated protein family)